MIIIFLIYKMLMTNKRIAVCRMFQNFFVRLSTLCLLGLVFQIAWHLFFDYLSLRNKLSYTFSCYTKGLANRVSAGKRFDKFFLFVLAMGFPHATCVLILSVTLSSYHKDSHRNTYTQKNSFTDDSKKNYVFFSWNFPFSKKLTRGAIAPQKVPSKWWTND